MSPIERPRGWILDASVAAKWYLRDEKDTTKADAILHGHVRGTAPLLAPQLIRYEVTNSLLRAVRSNRINHDYAQRATRRFYALPIVEPSDSEERLAVALELAYGMGISFYDAVYVALAEELGRQVVTADRGLHDRVEEHLPSSTVLLEALP
jgi:predicted nucleic acid-binding protein